MQDYSQDGETIYSNPNFDKQEQTSKGLTWWIIMAILICLFPTLAGWGYMATQGVGLYYPVSFDEWAIVESANKNAVGAGRMIIDCTYVDEVGIHYRGFNEVYKYPISGYYHFTGENGIKATLADGGQLSIGVALRIDMPKDKVKRMELHEYLRRNKTSIKKELREDVISALRSSVNILTIEESISGRRKEIHNMFHRQITDGLLMKEQYKSEDGKFMRSKFIKDELGEYVKAGQWNSFIKVYGLGIKSSHITQYNYNDLTRKHLQKIRRKNVKEKYSKLKAEEILKRDKIPGK